MFAAFGIYVRSGCAYASGMDHPMEATGSACPGSAAEIDSQGAARPRSNPPNIGRERLPIVKGGAQAHSDQRKTSCGFNAG